MEINQNLLDVAKIPKIEYDEKQNDIVEEDETTSKLSELIDTNIKGFSSVNFTLRNNNMDLLFIIKSGFDFIGELQNDSLEKLITIDESLKQLNSFKNTDEKEPDSLATNKLESLNKSFDQLFDFFTDEDRKTGSKKGGDDSSGITDKISESMTNLSDKWKNFGDGNSLLDKGLSSLSVALSSAFASLGTLIAGSFSTGVLGTIWAAIKTYAPWVMIGTGIANIFIDFYKSFKENGFSVKALIDGVLSTLFSGGFFAMASKYSAMGAGIGAFGGGVGAIPGAMIGGIVGMAMWGIKKIFGPEVFDKPKEIISNLYTGLSNIIFSTFNFIKDFYIKLWVTIKDNITKLVKDPMGTLNEWFDTIKNIISNIWGNVKNIFSGAFTKIKDFFVNTFNLDDDQFTEVFEKSKEVLSGLFNNIKDNIIKLVNDPIGTLTEWFDTIKNNIIKLVNDPMGTLTEWFDPIKNIISNIWGNVKNIFSGAFTKIKEFFVNTFNLDDDLFTEVFEKSKEVLSGLFNNIKGLVDPIVNFFGFIADIGKTSIKWLLDKTLVALPDFLETKIREKFNLTSDELKNSKSENEQINSDRVSYLETQIIELKNANIRLNERIQALAANAGNAIVQTNNTVKNDNVYQMPMTTPGSKGVHLNMQL